MWHKVFVPVPVLLIPVLIITVKSTHSSKNGSISKSDVIVTYSNHEEASDDVRDRVIGITEKSIDPGTVLVTDTTLQDHPEHEVTRTPMKETSEVKESPQEDVIFVPNDKEVVRNEEYLHRDRLNIQGMMAGQKTVGELLDKTDVRVEAVTQNTDIIFLMGKNHENNVDPEKEKPSRRWSYDHSRHQTDTTTPVAKLDCSNLNCNNSIKSVCGEKMENRDRRYRLFLNDCYFRKVNCNFQVAGNRYKKVTLDKCKNFGAHYNHTPFSFKPSPKLEPKSIQVNNTRRSIPSRRSMTMSIDGQFCSHACPTSCPQHYSPVCAVSSTGRHRVFVNHCALDHNSCSFGIVWQSRPLSECVGGKKADMRQNAAFIGWMQRVGIVDNKGRLTFNE